MQTDIKNKFSDFKFIEISVGGVSHRNRVKNHTNFRKFIKDRPDCYRSIFRRQKSFKDHVKKTGSVKDYRSEVYADWIVFDIDRENNLDGALSDLRQFLIHLEQEYGLCSDQVILFFSGYKGFHILLPTELFGGWKPSIDLPQKFRKCAFELADKAGIKIDKAIYDVSRLLRLSNTKNAKSGLYKIWISSKTALTGSLDQILEKAKQKQKTNLPSNFNECKKLVKLWKEISKEIEYENSANLLLNENETRIELEFVKPCINRLLSGIPQGNRHNAAFRITDNLFKTGYSNTESLNILKQWSLKCEPVYEDQIDLERIVKDIYSGKYDFGCRDSLLMKYCEADCRFNSPSHNLPRNSETRV